MFNKYSLRQVHNSQNFLYQFSLLNSPASASCNDYNITNHIMEQIQDWKENEDDEFPR